MIIEFDCGNTNIKWRTFAQTPNKSNPNASNSNDPNKGVLPHAAFTELTLKDIIKEDTRIFRVSSVADSACLHTLAQFAGHNGIDLHVAQTVAECAGVKNSYANPDAMGVDRWLAMLAAFQREQAAVCVIDAGTAMTIDYLDPEGQHLGGLILPGRHLLLSALAGETEKVLFDSEQGWGELCPGRSTGEAVHNGVSTMLAGAIKESFHGQNAANSFKFKVFFTGGDGAVLQGLIDADSELVPELVLDGLQYSLP